VAGDFLGFVVREVFATCLPAGREMFLWGFDIVIL